MDHYLNFIAGHWCDSDSKIDVENPATGEVFATIAEVTEAQVEEAIRAARVCVENRDLIKVRPVERATLLFKIANELREMAEEGARLLVRENGKTLSEAYDEFNTAARYLEYYAGMADKIEGRSIPLGDAYMDFTVYEPLGISAQIVPWNFPVDLCGRSLGPALAAGNAVIIKSPELTPLAITFFAKACERAGVPEGAVSILCGYGNRTGAQLVSHPQVDQIVFTGSVATGKSIMHAAADNCTPCVMELGGKSAAVVFADANLDVVIESVDWGIFFNAGQVCSAMSRLLVHEDIAEELIEKLKQLAESQVIGDGLDSSTSLTPLASSAQFEIVKALCAEGEQEGAELVTGGKPVDVEGFYFEPTVYRNVEAENPLFQKEVFGPVLSVTTFSNEEQAYELANASEFGLVAGVFTQDLNKAMRAAKYLKAGQVFVNEWYAGGVETPFGGVKNSGFGREKGQEALFSYVQTKNVAIRLLDS